MRGRLAGIVVALLVLMGGVGVVPAQAAVRADPLDDLLGPLLPILLPPTPTPTPTTATGDPAPGPLPGFPAPPVPGEAPRQYRAADGTMRPAASYFVPGNDGRTVFWGEDFDSACYDTAAVRRGLRTIARAAALIRRSGRRVVFTVAPNKSAVEKRELRGVEIPHGSCARRGLRAQERLLDTYRDPSYLPLRRALVREERLTYWYEDTHWTGVGSAVYARALADALEPGLGDRMRFRSGSATRQGMLHMPVPYTGEPERAATLLPGRGRKVRVPAGETDIDDASPTTFDHSWRTTPQSRTHRGRTLLVGDSFTALGLGVLRPVVARGRYLWHGVNTPGTIAAAVADADTVVIEVLQRFVPDSPFADPAFRGQLRQALRGSR